MTNEWQLVEEYTETFVQLYKEKNEGTLDCSGEEKCIFYLKLFTQLYENLKSWIEANNKLSYEKKLLTLEAIFLLKKPLSLGEKVSALYEYSFEVYCSYNKQLFEDLKDETDIQENDLDDEYCITCNQDTDCCRCEHILTLFSSLTEVLYKLGLYEHVLFPAVISVAYKQLSKFIEKHCKGQFFELWLERVLEWTERGLLNWLQFCTCNSNFSHTLKDYFTIEDWKPKLIFFVHKVFAELRISELFEIIVEYPDSLPAIHDLKECIYKTLTRQYLTESLKKAFENRLLHPAVNTDDILTQYVSAIRTLRELDPAGVILENVCAPLREYLRSREDTVKCIITCITDEESGPDLVEELISNDASGGYNSDDESDGEDWVPDPIDAKTDLSSRKQRTADIINILVNVYGSQDMFVSQYRILLADRILTNFTYDITNERRYLELLKRRFGENHLHFCDIMLKDIQDSQRINRLIKDDAAKEKHKIQQESIDFNAFILSSTFWPTLSDEPVEPPEEVKTLMGNYTELFKQLKGMRTLDWIHNLGSVELEVELQDGIKIFNVTPAQATLLLIFQRKDEWDLSELSRETSVNKISLRNRISFWVGQGVIIERPNDMFITATCFQSQNQDTTAYDSEEENLSSSQNQKEEELHKNFTKAVVKKMDFSFITEALKKVEYIEGYKNPTLFSSELSPTSSIEECVSSPKSKMFSHGQRSPTDGSDSPPSECKIESFKKSASLRQLYDSEFNKRNDGFASPEKQRRRFQRELINNSVSPPDLIASSPSLYHPHKDYLYSRSCSLSPFKSYHNNNSICYSRRSFNPYPLEKQEYLDHHREDFSVGEYHKYMKQESPTFNYTMSSRTQLYNQSRLLDSINAQSPHQQNISSNNDLGDIKFVHDEKQRGSFRKHNSCCAVCGDKLSSYFHGAVVCVSCQGFFKRALKNNRKYTCLGHRNCSLNKKTRNHCQACRLATCFKVGIKRDGVLEEIRQEKERKIAQKSVKKNNKIEHLSSTSSIDLKSIYDAEKFAHPHIGNFAEIKSHIIHHLCRSIDKQLVSLAEWARRLPCFGDLNITDQIKVLQSTWSELLIGALCFRSLTSDGLMLETGLYVSRASIEDNSFEATLTRTFDKALERMKELQVDMTEWGCLRAVILFNPDVNGLGAVDQVEETRERYLSTLIGYCKLICPNETNRFSKLLLCLPRIKSLALEVIEILKYSQLIANSSIDSFICDILADI